MKAKRNDTAMELSEFDKDFYKDSVNILGVSMDELEEFMNPSQQQLHTNLHGSSGLSAET